jgi:hypothetical protein
VKTKTNQAPAPQAIKSPLQRLDDLEAQAEMLLAVLQQQVERVNFVLPRIEALVHIAGEQTVEDKVDQMAVIKATDSIAKALGEGHLTPAEKVGDKCIVVAREYDADGKLGRPGRVQVQFDDIKDGAVKDGLRGLVPTQEYVDSTGAKIVVDEIYSLVPPPAPSAPSTDEAAPQGAE